MAIEKNFIPLKYPIESEFNSYKNELDKTFNSIERKIKRDNWIHKRSRRKIKKYR